MKFPRRQLLACLVAATANAHAAPVQGVLSLTVNGEDRGAVPLLVTDTGEWLIGEAELRNLGIQPTQVAETVEGKPYYPLRRLQGVAAEVNEAALTASLKADTALLGKQVISLIPKPASALTPPAALSGYLNYQLGLYTQAQTGPTLILDGALRSFQWLLDGDAYYQQGVSSSLSKRLKLSHDWPDSMVRLEVGDLPAQSSVPGQSLAMRGISISRAFDTQPYFQRMPGARFAGSVGVPAQAEIKVDGVTVKTVTLTPGTFDINSLAYRTGLHNATVTIRDQAGNVISSIGGPTYFSTLGLAKGVSDYGISVGRLTDNSRGDLGFSGRYARGVSDVLTLGASAQGEGRERYGSAMGTLTAGVLGVVTAQVTKAFGDVHGAGIDTAYSWLGMHFGVNLAAQRYGRDFFSKSLLGARGLTPVQSVRGAMSYSQASGLAYRVALASRRYLDNTSAHSISVGYSRHVGNATLTADVGRIVGSAPEKGATANITLNWQFGGARRMTAYMEKSQYGTNNRVDVSDITPEGAGFGYRVSAQGRPQAQGNGYLEYGFQDAIVAANFTHAGQASVGAAYLTSSVAYVGGNLRASRMTRDSFAIADVGLPGVRVLRNNQLVGRTGADGKLFVPYLSPYSANQLTLDEQDVPGNYSLEPRAQVVTPARHAGVVVKFDMKPMRSAGGRIAGFRERAEDESLILKDERDITVPLTSESGERTTLTVRADGSFYFDELGEGTWSGALDDKTRSCRLSLVVPPHADPYLDLGEIACETP